MLPIINLYTCKETIARLDDYLDRELSAEEIRRVERHLRICHACTRKFGFEKKLLAQMRARLARLETPPELWDRITYALAETEE
ncbi:MAG: putative transrane anti-sigma factor [Chthonomonadaceae bacterium]|nr:putative transrane anti-sigma factor [Chthonomonadaceae bacterium]